MSERASKILSALFIVLFVAVYLCLCFCEGPEPQMEYVSGYYVPGHWENAQVIRIDD